MDKPALLKTALKNDKISNFILFFVFLSLFVFFSFSTTSFFNTNNFMNILRQSAVTGILATAMTFVIISGGIDLSVGSILAFAGVILGSIAKTGNDRWWLGVIAALICASLLGLINGVLIGKYKVVPFIQTLAMLTIGRGLTMLYADGKPISDLAQGLTGIAKMSFMIPVVAWIFIITIIISHLILYYTVFGRSIYAVGGNEKAALISGIDTVKIKIMVYTLSGFLCGISAVILTSRVSSALPRAGDGYEMDAIAAVVIGGASLSGGRGNVWCTLIGVLIINILGNGMDLMNINSYGQQIIKGVIIILAVFLDSVKNKE
ncbi:MAG: ABC transporter permease [Proteobacteria bacterium]|nr:ABC transporter permease [Pseudomonadota bacterium]MBU1541694.1 ABC transporter permease [Pseudomonadota bacterium]